MNRIRTLATLSLLAAAPSALHGQVPQPPIINSLATTPSPVFAGDNFTLIVLGQRFCFGGTQIRFNLVDYPATFVSSTELRTAIPGAATAGRFGPVPVQVVHPTFASGCPGPGLSSNVSNYNIQPTPLNVATTSLPSGLVGTSYSVQLSVSGGAPPYTFARTGSLPPGLNLANGVISGTPALAGSFPFTISFSDLAGQSVDRNYTILIETPLQITTASLPDGVQNALYRESISVIGGRSPYTFSLIGLAPPGLDLLPTGFLSGTPAQVGTFNVQVRVFDAREGSVTRTIPLTIRPALRIVTSSLPPATTNVAYGPVTLEASGGVTPYRWTLLSGAPAGITLSQSGILSGTPTQSGTFPLQILLQDLRDNQDTRTLNLVVSSGLQITTSSLPAGTINALYPAQQLAASGGEPPLTWNLLGGAPAGLTLTTAGVLSGTPTQSGSFALQVQVQDSRGAQASRTLSLQISAAPLQITTTSLAPVTPGVAYTAALTAAGGSGAYEWSTASPLPSGITLSTGGVLAGTTQQTGSFPLLIVVRDQQNQTANANLTLVVGAALQLLTQTLPAGAANAFYSTQLAASGGVAPYQWSALSGLPAGFSIDAASGILSGLSAIEGTFQVTIQVRDAAGVVVQRTFPLTIGNALTITNINLRTGIVGTLYEEFFQVSGGTPPYTWATVGSAVPGLFLNPVTGALSGTPTLQGVFNLTVRVTDSLNQSGQRSYSLTVNPGFRITTETLPAATVGAFYEQTLLLAGGTGPFVWSLSGVLPQGITLNASTGVLSGTPNQAGTFAITVSVLDSLGQQTSRQLTLTASQAIRIAPDTAPNGTVRVAYALTFTASGGTAPYSFALLNAIPGLTLDSGTGLLRGTPEQAGNFPFTIRAVDARGLSATRDYTLLVNAPLRVVTEVLPDGFERSVYAQTLEASGGVAPYTWRIISGALPEGLSLNTATGAISGTPVIAGSTTATFEVADAAGTRASQALTLAVRAGLAVQTAGTISNGVVGTAYSFALTAIGGTAPYRWRLAGGALPAGLNLDVSGLITGTPTAAGRTTGNVEVTDAANRAATAEIVINVQQPLLRFTSGATLPAATAGVDYQFTPAVSGGTPPYRFTLNGAPAGLVINETSGQISGRLATPGDFPFAIRVTDSAGVQVDQQVTVRATLPPAPPLTISGVPATGTPGQQVTATASIGQPYPVPISGELVMTFASEVGVDDPAIQFATGGRRIVFNIPAGSTQAVFNANAAGIQTGTVAGTITLTAQLTAAGTNVTPSPAPTQTVRIARAAPVISTVRATRTATGFDVAITGFSTPREVASATIRLTTTGAVQGTEFTVNIAQAMAQWYQSAPSVPFGSLFTLTIPFTVQTGTAGGTVSGVSVTLTNAVGTSAAASATF